MSRRYVPARKPHSPTVCNEKSQMVSSLHRDGAGSAWWNHRSAHFVGSDSISVLLASDTNISADQLARRVIRNELKVRDEDHSHWMYRVEQEKNGRDEVWQIIETKDGDLGRLLAVNGRPLSREEQRKEDWRIQSLVTDPEEQKRLQKARNNDSDEAMSLLQTLPDAFLFNYVSHRGELVEMQFTPNPKFEPSSREAHVFHQMEGRMWVNTSALRLVQIEGHLHMMSNLPEDYSDTWRGVARLKFNRLKSHPGTGT
jgi:hypothetical protein